MQIWVLTFTLPTWYWWSIPPKARAPSTFSTNTRPCLLNIAEIYNMYATLSDKPGWSEVASFLPVTSGQVEQLESQFLIHNRIHYFCWLYFTSALANKDSELTPPATSTPDHVSFLKRLQPCWPSRGTSMSSSLKHGKEIFKSYSIGLNLTLKFAQRSSCTAEHEMRKLQNHQAEPSALRWSTSVV